MSSLESHAVYRFGQFELHEASESLWAGNERVVIAQTPFRALLLLLQNAPDTVSKRELFETIWHNRVVTDGVLTQAISRIRVALKDQDSQIIRNVHGVGFRLGLLVEKQAHAVKTAVQNQAISNSALQERLKSRPLWQLQGTLTNNGRSPVWLAKHRNDGSLRVFKFAHDASGLRALKREVSVSRVLQAAGTDHHVRHVLDADFSDAPFFLELQYLPGGNLVTWLDGNPNAPIQTRLALLAQLAQTLSQCHAVGIIHGDVKPKNILMNAANETASAFLADFGSATLLDVERLRDLELSAVHRSGMSSDPGGTMMYSAPEVLIGKPPTTASDAYALGVTAFQLLSGEFSHPLAPGWEQLIAEPLLRNDIVALCQALPEQRPRDLNVIAEGWLHLDLRKQRAAQDEADRMALQVAQTRQRELEQLRDFDRERIAHLSTRRRILHWALASSLAIMALGALGYRKLLEQTSLAKKQTESAQHFATESDRFRRRAEAVQRIFSESLVDMTNPYVGSDPKTPVIDILEPISSTLVAELNHEADYLAPQITSIAAALMHAKRLESARRVLENALHIKSMGSNDRSEVEQRLGDVFRMQGRVRESVPHYLIAQQQAVLQERKTSVNFSLALASIRSGNLRELELAIARLPKTPHSRLSGRVAYAMAQGYQALLRGKLDESEAIFSALANGTEPADGPFHQVGWRGLGAVAAERGMPDQAIDFQQRALNALDDKFSAGTRPSYECELAKYYVAAGRWTEAEAMLTRLIDENNADLGADFYAIAQFQLARVRFHQGNRNSAFALLQQAKTGIVSSLSEHSQAYRELASFAESVQNQAPVLASHK